LDSIFRDLPDEKGLNTDWAELGQGHFSDFHPAEPAIFLPAREASTPENFHR
jgi:hypothetical protein